MKIRRIILIILIFSFIFSLSSCKKNNESPRFLWEVTSDRGTKVYLMGSIHVGDDSIYPLDSIIMDAFNESTILAVEADIDGIADDKMTEILNLYAYPDFEIIDNHINKDLLEKAISYLQEEGQYNPVYHYFKPVFWVDVITGITLKKSGLDSEKGIDLFFIKEAKEKGKEIYELESIEFQASLMSSLRDEVQEFYLQDTINNLDSLEESLLAFYSIWKSGKESDLLDILEETAKQEEYQKLYEEYSKLVIEDRNKEMAKEATRFLEGDKTVFFLIGLGHIVGDMGIIDLLKAEGYRVVRR